MERDAAHGYPAFGTCIFPCQRQFQFMGCRQGIIIKELIKIAEPIEKEAVLVSILYLLILCH